MKAFEHPQDAQRHLPELALGQEKDFGSKGSSTLPYVDDSEWPPPEESTAEHVTVIYLPVMKKFRRCHPYNRVVDNVE